MKIFYYILLIGCLLNISLFGQQKSLYKYKVVIDFGSDLSDPIFTEYSLKEFLKEKMSQRLPEFSFTDFDDASVILKLTLLTHSGSEVNNNFVSASNLLIVSPYHRPLNWNALTIESKMDKIQNTLRELFDKWILEYSAFIYKTQR